MITIFTCLINAHTKACIYLNTPETFVGKDTRVIYLYGISFSLNLLSSTMNIFNE